MNRQTASRYINRLDDLVRERIRLSSQWFDAPYTARDGIQAEIDDCQQRLDEHKRKLIQLMTEDRE